MSLTGTLKTFVDGKGFGFITRDDGQADIFVHFSKLTNAGQEDMIVGTRMSFDEEVNKKNGKTCATNVRIEDAAGGGSVGQGQQNEVAVAVALDLKAAAEQELKEAMGSGDPKRLKLAIERVKDFTEIEAERRSIELRLKLPYREAAMASGICQLFLEGRCNKGETCLQFHDNQARCA